MSTDSGCSAVATISVLLDTDRAVKTTFVLTMSRTRRREQFGVRQSQPPIRVGVIAFTNHDLDAQIMQPQRFGNVWRQDDIGMATMLKLPNQRHFDRAVGEQHDMPFDATAEFPRRHGGGLCLHPRRIEELDEGEGKEDQHEQRAAEQHDDREEAA